MTYQEILDLILKESVDYYFNEDYQGSKALNNIHSLISIKLKEKMAKNQIANFEEEIK